MTIEWWSYESGVMAKDFLDTSVRKIIVASIAEKVQETYHNFSVMFEKKSHTTSKQIIDLPLILLI